MSLSQLRISRGWEMMKIHFKVKDQKQSEGTLWDVDNEDEDGVTSGEDNKVVEFDHDFF